MKKQKIKFRTLSKAALSWLMLLVLNTTSAQTPFANSGNLIDDGGLYTVPSNDKKYRDLIIPTNTSAKQLYLRLKGADGGRVKADGFFGAGAFIIDAGAGATLPFLVEIGNNEGQIPPGSKLRFIVGEQGENAHATTIGCYNGGGGGGTGLAFQAPGTDTSWVLLAVAGAGSGAHGRATEGSEGHQGHGVVARVAGKDTGTGGSSYDGGCTESASGGGGAFENGENGDPMGCTLVYGGEAGWPDGPDSGTPTGGNGRFGGGWGFGGGGGNIGGSEDPTGGGGGYQGGNAAEGVTGDGGHSFLNETYATGNAITNGTTESPADGFVEYKFINPRYITLAANPNSTLTKEGTADNVDNALTIWLYKRVTKATYLNNKLWLYDDFSQTIRMASDVNKCIDLTASNTTNGTAVELWDCHGGTNQQWIFEDNLIKSALDQSKCLIIKNNNFEDANPAVLWSCSSATDVQKKWMEINYVSSDEDVTPPVAKCKDIAVSGGNLYALAPEAIDNYSYDNYDITEWILDKKALKVGTTTVTLKVKDGQGNAGSCTAKVTLTQNPVCTDDTTPPVARCKDIWVSGTLVAITPELVNNYSTDNCGIANLSLDQTGFSGSPGASRQAVLTVKDTNGNTNTCTSTITFK